MGRLETDCSPMVKALNSKEDRLEISFLIAKAKELAQLLRGWEVLQVKRVYFDCS
jgi:hypothetical protein